MPATAGRRLDNNYAWALAVTPLVYLLVAAALGGFGDAGIGLAAVAELVALIALVNADHRRLDTVGASVSSALGVFVIPIYLLVRTRRAGSTPLIPILWVAAAAASWLAWDHIVPMQIDTQLVSQEASSQLSNASGSRVDVTCPDSAYLRVGQSMDCHYSSADGFSGLLLVTLKNSDGYVSWQPE